MTEFAETLLLGMLWLIPLSIAHTMWTVYTHITGKKKWFMRTKVVVFSITVTSVLVACAALYTLGVITIWILGL